MADSINVEDLRMSLASKDVLGQRMEQLRELFPEAFVEGPIDFDRLRNALGDFVGEGRERYGLSWAGKADAIRAIQAPSVGTLVPCPEESVNFDTTENLLIEGDNLEVLKLLQKSYYGKVKMIYIDPPYNTGGEFIYPDNFHEGLEDYLRYSEQSGEDGVRLSTNTETSGRYHSKWLDMIYPRLFLARNLLRQDGVIFVSIDDHEVHNLRLLMDEVFGPENFLASIIWQKRYSVSADAKGVPEMHDYILLYRRSDTFVPNLGPRTEKQDSHYKNPDNDPRGPWRADNLTRSEFRERDVFIITSPTTGKESLPPKGASWRHPKETIERMIADNRIWFGKDGNARPVPKRFLSEVRQGVVIPAWWPHTYAGHNDEATKEMQQLFDGDNPFDTPKPSRLIRRMLELATSEKSSDIVVDFFAGSCTTADAVMQHNHGDGGNRRFIMVQLPEPTSEKSDARRLGYSNIAEVGLERIRRAIAKITHSKEGMLDGIDDSDLPEDLGCRVLRLKSSNFQIWDGTEDSSAEKLQEQLQLFADHVLPDRSEQDILYELMLKAGLSLTAAIEEKTVANQKVYSIAEGLLFICLANPITQECLRGMAKLEPQRVVCLDAAFGGNDQLKTNTVLEMKSHGIEFRTV